MVLIFDLDDTLYDEATLVKSGFRAVARFLEMNYGLPASSCGNRMRQILDQKGRGHVFDELLRSNGMFSRTLVRKCLAVYRSHDPQIRLFPGVRTFLRRCSKFPLYLVTDGNLRVQSNKVKALKIVGFFKKIYLTHRYGLQHAKPSVYCFTLIQKREKCNYSEMIYIADNPDKDFINVRRLGMRTIRALTGRYGKTAARRGFDATIRIEKVIILISDSCNHQRSGLRVLTLKSLFVECER